MSDYEARNAEWERLHVEEGWTLSEIGREYGMTGERVRQVLRERGVPEWVTANIASLAAKEIRRERLRVRRFAFDLPVRSMAGTMMNVRLHVEANSLSHAEHRAILYYATAFRSDWLDGGMPELAGVQEAAA